MSDVVYEVTVEVEPDLLDDFVRYMTGKHIPEIHAIGCFRRVRFERAGPTTLRTSYHAANASDLDRYLEHHAAGFRADFAAHFPSGTRVSRVTWTVLANWE